jgi:hypothetical protein
VSTNNRTDLKSQLVERRLDRMRLGQAATEIIPLVSDPEFRVALVPLRESEYRQVLSIIARIQVSDTMAGLQFRDRVQSEELLVRSLRDPKNLDTWLFDSAEEMNEILDVADIDMLIDEFNEMSEKSNPAIDQIPEEEFVVLKKVLQTMDWNALSGRSWYAAKRFLGALTTQGLLRGSFLGSTSISPLITMSEEEESTPTAS